MATHLTINEHVPARGQGFDLLDQRLESTLEVIAVLQLADANPVEIALALQSADANMMICHVQRASQSKVPVFNVAGPL